MAKFIDFDSGKEALLKTHAYEWVREEISNYGSADDLTKINMLTGEYRILSTKKYVDIDSYRIETSVFVSDGQKPILRLFWPSERMVAFFEIVDLEAYAQRWSFLLERYIKNGVRIYQKNDRSHN